MTQAIDFYSLQDAVAEKGEIFLGYKERTAEGDIITMNPVKLKDGKKTEMVFEPDDELVVLAESMVVKST